MKKMEDKRMHNRSGTPAMHLASWMSCQKEDNDKEKKYQKVFGYLVFALQMEIFL